MSLRALLLAVLLCSLPPSPASAAIYRYNPPPNLNLNGLTRTSPPDVVDPFASNLRPSWHSVSGQYEITSGDLASELAGTIRGTDSSYLRVLGRDCSNFSPADCDQAGGVLTYVDLEEIAGPAIAYHVWISFDLVAEGDMDGTFTWDVLDSFGSSLYALYLGSWSDNDVNGYYGPCGPGTISLCWIPATLQYEFGRETIFRDFWVVGDTGFTQKFFSTEPYGFWAIDGFWGIDNLTVDIVSYSEPSIEDPPQRSVSEPNIFALLVIGFLGLATSRSRKRN